MRSPRFRSAAAAFAVLVIAAAARAQVEWQRRELMPRHAGSIAFDIARDRLLVHGPRTGVGEPETWEWDRVAWRRRQPASAPPARQGHGLCHDPVRGVTVRFSGFAISTFRFAETWEWDGTDWRDVSPALQPPPRIGQAMVFDAGRNRVVLFGGVSTDPNGGTFGDTWEWNGASWTQLPVAGPPARSGHGMAYDSARGEIVLFGGMGPSGLGVLGDTWTLANGVWTQRAPVASPGARTGAVLGFAAARGRVVLFGGLDTAHRDDTWEWDGVTWSPAAPTLRPGPRAHAGMATDPVSGDVLLSGGADAVSAAGDLWRWDGSAWHPLLPSATLPPRHSHAATFDPVAGRALVFGGVGNAILGDFWQWDGARWTELSTAGGPSPRSRAALAFDAARNRAVMFGGELPGFTAETWEWDGAAWQRRAVPAPVARILHRMVYDPARRRVVLFGGIGGSYPYSYLGDTWEWDGAAWTQRAASGPAARHGHCLAHDDARGVTVLYGGVGAGQPFGTWFRDTWEWNGTLWTRRTPAGDPGLRSEFGLAYDGLRGRVVLFGDTNNADTWEWDGVDWRQRQVALAPPARGRAALVYDSHLGRALLIGGQSSGPNHEDLWEYGPSVPAAVVGYGLGCAGGAGTATLATAGLPWLGDSVTLAVRTAPAGGLATIWLGTSRTAWPGGALPQVLDPWGMPGCHLWASIDAVSLLLADTAGVARLPVAVPANPVLLGAVCFTQGGFVDVGANAAGLVVTGGIALTLGGR